MPKPDAPARALVIHGDGLMPFISPSHSHLHALAALGSCGFLALRHLPPRVNGAEREVCELKQLLDAHKTYTSRVGGEGYLSKCQSTEGGAGSPCCSPSISERFMGMKAAMVTTTTAAANLGKSMGLSVIMMDEMESHPNGSNKETVGCKTNSQLPNPSMTAPQLLDLLGLNGPCLKDANTFDLVLLHVGGSFPDDESTILPENLDWINALVGEVKSLVQPGTTANDHLYLALVLGYGDLVILHDRTELRGFPSLEQLDGLTPALKALRPQQTYRMKDGHVLDDVRDHHPLLVVHQMDSVTRRDQAQMLSFEEFQKKGGNLTILADRFLHEIAFKLWKAPKYGA